MSVIQLDTFINAPVQKCFDLSRSIDLHIQSMKHTQEKATAGICSGYINLHETVSWQAKHLGCKLTMTVQIIAMKAPDFFVDEQVAGPFCKLTHKHLFLPQGYGTSMLDIFEFESPFGLLGKLTDRLFLANYMRRLLVQRNKVIKIEAEKEIPLSQMAKGDF